LKQKASIEANRTLAKSSKTGSYPELYLRDKLKEINIGFEFQYPIVIGENLSIVDIFIKPNICIFVDGEYWHNYPSGTEKDKMVKGKLEAQVGVKEDIEFKAGKLEQQKGVRPTVAYTIKKRSIPKLLLNKENRKRDSKF